MEWLGEDAEKPPRVSGLASPAMTKKIAFIGFRFHQNQIAWVKALASRGHRVHYFVAKPDTLSYQIDEDLSGLFSTLAVRRRFEIFSVRNDVIPQDEDDDQFLRMFSIRIGKFIAQLRDFGPDLLIARDQRMTLFPAFLASRVLQVPLAIYHQRPLCSYPEATNSERAVGRFGPLKRFLLNFFWQVSPIPCMHSLVSPSQYRCPKNKKTIWLPFVVKPVSVRTTGSQARQIISVGKFRAYKNHSMILRAFHALKNQVTGQTKLILMGRCKSSSEKAEASRLRRLIEKLGLGEHVTLMLNVPHEEALKLMDQGGVFVLASKNEHASLATLEAMARGLAVVCAAGNGTNLYFTDGESGETFNPEYESSLTKKLVNLARDPDKIRRLGESAQNRVAHYCAEESFITGFNALLEDIFPMEHHRFQVNGNDTKL